MNNKYTYNHIRLGTIAWLLGAIMIGIVMWYSIGYFSYKIYHQVTGTSKHSFRYSLHLLER